MRERPEVVDIYVRADWSITVHYLGMKVEDTQSLFVRPPERYSA